MPVLPPRLAGVFAGWAVCRQTSFRRASISHGCPCPSSLSAMMEHTFIPLMPDCHGRLFCFALEKSVAPRGDQISVNRFQTTAPPSRVNFREIRAPGVSTLKMQKSPESRLRCGNIAACSRLSGLFFFAFQFSFVQNGTDFSKGCKGRKKF